MSPNQASQWFGYFQRRFTLLSDREEVLTRWQGLVTTNRSTRPRSHDARLVAAMR